MLKICCAAGGLGEAAFRSSIKGRGGAPDLLERTFLCMSDYSPALGLGPDEQALAYDVSTTFYEVTPTLLSVSKTM